jgi:hypothetical protein
MCSTWWQTTIFYESFDEPGQPYHWGVVVHQPSGGKTYTPKPVFAFLSKVASSQPLFGGNKTDCDDGLDNDLDGKVDSADPDCITPGTASEGPPPPPGTEPGVDAGASADAGPSGGSSGGAGNDGGAAGLGNGAGDSSGPSGSSGGGCALTQNGDGNGGLVLLALPLFAVGLRAARRRTTGRR